MQNYLSKVREDFTRSADNYDHFAQLQRLSLIDFWQRLHPGFASRFQHQVNSAIDIGSGSGGALHAIQQLMDIPVHQWVGVDISTKMLAINRNLDVKICADMQSLPFVDNSFELVVSNFALHWCQDVCLAIEEIKRILAPGGVAVVSFPVYPSLEFIAKVWRAHGYESPLHGFPEFDKLVARCTAPRFNSNIEMRISQREVPLDFSNAIELLGWFKKTGARSKQQKIANIGPRKYRSIQSQIDTALTVDPKVVAFSVCDILVFAN